MERELSELMFAQLGPEVKENENIEVWWSVGVCLVEKRFWIYTILSSKLAWYQFELVWIEHGTFTVYHKYLV